MKTNKKMWIIGSIIVLALIVGIIWWYSSSKSKSTPVDVNSSTLNQDISAKIATKIADIKADTEWSNQIKANAVSQGYTLAQAYAVNAIWGLKHDGIIPMDTYGAGEYGHIDYVKKNY